MATQDFDLPESIVSGLPSDPFEQLDIARKITSIALTTRVYNLESESLELRQSIAEKDNLIAELSAKVESLEASLADSSRALAQADEKKVLIANFFFFFFFLPIFILLAPFLIAKNLAASCKPRVHNSSNQPHSRIRIAMGTEILRPQNCLIRSIPLLCNPNPNPNSHNPKSFKKNRSRSPKQPKGIAIGQVTILKRGESPISDPKPKQIRIVADRVEDGYAGSAISMSPSPRSVPLPNFWSREESATKDLRRLLRLD